MRVADVNGDGVRNAADLQEGDIVVVKARLPRRAPGAAPFVARKVVDQSHGREHTRGHGGRPASASREQGHYPVKAVMAPIPINIADWVGRTPMVQLTRLLPDAPASSSSRSSRCSTPAARSRTASASR